jgi:hypothetical protein
MAKPIPTVARAIRSSLVSARRAVIVTVPPVFVVNNQVASTLAIDGLSTSNTIDGCGETERRCDQTATTMSQCYVCDPEVAR